jgi:hypothetical protein
MMKISLENPLRNGWRHAASRASHFTVPACCAPAAIVAADKSKVTCYNLPHFLIKFLKEQYGNHLDLLRPAI